MANETFSAEAHRALQFARRHDWGVYAYLEHGTRLQDRHLEVLCGLIVECETQGEWHLEDHQILATMKNVRDFGGY